MSKMELTTRDRIAEACRRAGLDADVERLDESVVVVRDPSGMDWTFAQEDDAGWILTPSWMVPGTYHNPPEVEEGEEAVCRSLSEALRIFAERRARTVMDGALSSIDIDLDYNADRMLDPAVLFPAAEDLE